MDESCGGDGHGWPNGNSQPTHYYFDGVLDTRNDDWT